MKASILTLLATGALAAYVPSDPWSTLTPDTVLGPTTSYSQTFGIQVITLDGSASTAAASTTSASAAAITGANKVRRMAVETATAEPVVSETTEEPILATNAPFRRISDGQVHRVKRDDVTCRNDSDLSMTLSDGVLTDARGRLGCIVANRQFQFDGPPPQAGAIYAAGWSITEEGNLAIGATTTFYQCLSGTFYNLYDETLGAQCHPVNLRVVPLVDC